MSSDSHVEVGYEKGKRYTLVARPSSSLSPSAAPLALDADSVVVLLGGARGITALAARALARRFRCKIELAGRSELAEEAETPALQGAKNAADVRRVLAGLAAERGERDPRTIDQQCRRILANREIRETLSVARQRRLSTIIRSTYETKLPWQRSSINCASGMGGLTSSFTALA